MQKQTFSQFNLQVDHYTFTCDTPLIYGGIGVVSDAPPSYLHRHNCLEIGLCFEGQGVFIIDDRIIPYGPGDISVIGEMQFHIAQSARNVTSKWAFLLIDVARFQPVGFNAAEISRDVSILLKKGPGILPKGEHPFVAKLVEEIIGESEGKETHFREVISSLMTSLIYLVSRLTPEESSVCDKRELEAISPALRYIAEHYTETLTVPELAGICCISETHLRRLFHAALGETPHDYLAKLRINMAAVMLLSSPSSVLDVAGELGYETLSTFNRQFRALLGVSPREWRKAAGTAGSPNK